MSDLQRDIELIDAVIRGQGWPQWEAAWQRLKPRLTPDRERVARAIAGSLGGNPRVGELPPSWMKAADAAIAAMELKE